MRILFNSPTHSDLGKLAAMVTRSLAPANLDISCWYIDHGESAPLFSERIEMTEFALDPLTVKGIDEKKSKKTTFDIIISIGFKSVKGWITYPGFPVCLSWPDIVISQPVSEDSYREVISEIIDRSQILYRDGILGSVTQLRKTFGSLIENLTDGIMVHDRSRRILMFNKSAEQITGYQAAELIGKDCHQVFPGFFCGGDCAFCKEGEKHFDKLRYPNRFLRPSGETRDLEMSVVTFSADNEENYGAMVIFRDVTELNTLRKRIRRGDQFQGIVGRHPSIQKVFESIEELSDVNVPVLIQGESGTGKEMVAEALHALSLRSDHPFVPVNCGALPEGTLESELFGHVRGAFTGAIRDKKGRFELADGGTLFLDEIGEISANMQVKLLRVLQESSFIPVGGEKTVHVDVRVICATNRNLKTMIRKGEFREDLYYRLAVVPIYMPLLKDRISDIPLLIQHFVERHSEVMGQPKADFSNEAVELMMQYSWPGNVRELSNAVQYAMIKCHGGVVTLEHLPREIREGRGVARTAVRGRPAKVTEHQILQAITTFGNNQTKAAEALGISRMTLYRHLKKMGKLADRSAFD